jgi:hypothetical protein
VNVRRGIGMRDCRATTRGFAVWTRESAQMGSLDGDSLPVLALVGVDAFAPSFLSSPACRGARFGIDEKF